MKYVIIAFLCVCNFSSCTGQNNKNNINMDEKLDIKWFERKAEKTTYDNGVVSYYLEYKEKDGTMVIIEGNKKDGFTESRISKNSYSEIYKEYYPNGILKEKGKLFGEETSIGMWHYFDEQGNVVKTVDEDKKFGKFGYMDVLNFLIEKDYVEKDTYKGLFESYMGISVTVVFSEEDLTWQIRVKTPGYIINDYTIDGNTGEIKEHKVFQGGKM